MHEIYYLTLTLEARNDRAMLEMELAQVRAALEAERFARQRAEQALRDIEDMIPTPAKLPLSHAILAAVVRGLGETP